MYFVSINMKEKTLMFNIQYLILKTELCYSGVKYIAKIRGEDKEEYYITERDYLDFLDKISDINCVHINKHEEYISKIRIKKLGEE